MSWGSLPLDPTRRRLFRKSVSILDLYLGTDIKTTILLLTDQSGKIGFGS